MAETDARRGRPRRTETDERIVRATQELIREHGPSAVNVAAVSARSGVARTTIYRRYADRESLLGAALQPLAEHGEPADGLPVPEKVAWMLARTEDVLNHGIGLGGVGAVLADTDPEFSAALRESLELDSGRSSTRSPRTSRPGLCRARSTPTCCST